jgi:uncharacterized membrane-anchored protein
MKIKFEEAEKIAVTELRAMLPFFLVTDVLIVIICTVYIFFSGNADYTLFTGLLLGNIAAAFNFYFMARAAGKLTTRGEDAADKPRRTMGVSYGVRIIVLFVVYYGLMTLGVINPITALIPLLFPSFYYKFKAIFNKNV